MRFQKKPTEVEAVQYANNEYADHPLCFKQEPPDWLQQEIGRGTIKPEFRTEDYWYLIVQTPNGHQEATPGDYIVRDMDGEVYVCSKGLFESQFDPIESDSSDSDLPDTIIVTYKHEEAVPFAVEEFVERNFPSEQWSVMKDKIHEALPFGEYVVIDYNVKEGKINSIGP